MKKKLCILVLFVVGNSFCQAQLIQNNTTDFSAKDHWTVGISGLALLISIIALIISIVQKKTENARLIRKTLSDSLENIAKINIEFLKLKRDGADYNDDNTIELRRVYNTQRRILIAHADYLVEKNDKLVTDIDCNLLATSYNAIGDYTKAESYWQKTINKSLSDSIKHMNLRGYARFLFFQGKFQLGRSKYEEALKLGLPDTDDVRRQITDTYLLWARVEKDFNNITEAKRLIELAKGYCSRIGHNGMKSEMLKRIEKLNLTIS